MIQYLINSTLCSGLLFLTYKLFLEKEKMHQFNRFYLIFAIILSLIVPLISIEKEVDIIPLESKYLNLESNFLLGPSENIEKIKNNKIATNPINWQSILMNIYALISLLLFVKLIYNLNQIFAKIKKNKKLEIDGATLVSNPENQTPHSFLHYIFIEKTVFENGNLEKEILLHEHTHIKQKHSLDILFIETIKCIFWINPLLILYKKAIQINHEFLADDAVNQAFNNVHFYQNLLLKKAYQPAQNITSQFNFQTTKTRLIMMRKTSSKTMKTALLITAISIIATVFYLFSKNDKKQNNFINVIEFNEVGVSEEVLADYQNSTSKYFSVLDHNSFLFRTIPKKEEERLLKIFKKMSKTQQNNQDFIFDYLPANKKNTPSNKLFESFKDSSKYEKLVIDGVNANFKELSKFKNTEFSQYFSVRTNKLPGGFVSKKPRIELMTNNFFTKREQKYERQIVCCLNMKKGVNYLEKKYLKKS